LEVKICSKGPFRPLIIVAVFWQQFDSFGAMKVDDVASKKVASSILIGHLALKNGAKEEGGNGRGH
jgi:hypothetical protein